MRAFPTTRWSWIREASQEDVAEGRPALNGLLRRYFPALRSHLTQRWSLPPEQADDLLQDFIASRILEHDLLTAADEQKGKFRTLLLTALDRFAISRRRHQTAQKRAGVRTVRLDDSVAEPELEPAVAAESREFDVVWVRQILKETLARMQRECRMARRVHLWTIFERRILRPTLEGSEPVDYEQLVQSFGLRSALQARNTLTTAKRMFIRILRKVVGEYMPGEDQITSEIEELRQSLLTGGASR